MHDLCIRKGSWWESLDAVVCILSLTAFPLTPGGWVCPPLGQRGECWHLPVHVRCVVICFPLFLWL